MPELRREGEVYILDLGEDENRFNPTTVGEIVSALEEVKTAEGPRALVTSAQGKFFSNGLDLDWMGSHPGEAGDLLTGVHSVLARLLLLPVPTVAAIQGHAFAAGAMLTLGHDFRVMRADRGFWCLNEVDVGLPFTPGMSALIRSRLAPQLSHEAMTTARRYGGSDARSVGIVDDADAISEPEVLKAALERAAALAGKAGPALGRIKAGIYGDVADRLHSSGPLEAV